ncbi:MAG: hypothetical protein QNK04_23685 [Myxococcota bacterium]|nr:hypothetical protein [Myxococcota bacterium]
MALVTAYGVRTGLSSRSALALTALLALTAVVTVDGIVAPVEALERRRAEAQPIERGDPELVDAVAESQHLLGLVTFLTVGDDAQTAHLLEQRPALLSGIVVVLLLLAPFVAAVSAFDQTAGDIGSRWMRFVVFRTRRSSVFLGRLAAAAMLLLLLYAALAVAVVGYLDLRLGVYPRGELYGWGAQGYLALGALSLPYVALCALVSGASRSAVRALGACVLATALPLLALGVLGARFDALAWIDLLHPWGWKLRLLHPDAGVRAGAYAAMLAFTAALAWVGAVLFARRDL